jgi:spore coat polysaccharide biosynthesis protein SpsF (cytidylyltransferase family)
MGSTRLPGKVPRDLARRPMRAQVLRRSRACTPLDEIVVATSIATSDDPSAEVVSHVRQHTELASINSGITTWTPHVEVRE